MWRRDTRKGTWSSSSKRMPSAPDCIVGLQHVSYGWMHTIRRIGVAFALLVSLFAPSMACALPSSRLTDPERACCRRMQGECGQMKMPASHSCCRHDVGPSHVDATQPQSGSFHPVISLPVLLPQSALTQPPTVAGQWIVTPDHSPPISSAPAISILRI